MADRVSNMRLVTFVGLLHITDMLVYILGYLSDIDARRLFNSTARLKEEKRCFLRWHLTKDKSVAYWKSTDSNKSFRSCCHVYLNRSSSCV